jgi:hypothetical protein
VGFLSAWLVAAGEPSAPTTATATVPSLSNWIFPGHVVQQGIPQTTSVPLLLLNLSVALDKDLLLQPNFYTTEPLTRIFGGAPSKWLERVETKGGRVIRVRDGSVSIENQGYPALALVVHEEISRPAGKVIVLDGPAPSDQRVSGSITARLGANPDICVCDVRDWVGFETRVASAADRKDLPAGSKGALVFDFPSDDAQKSIDLFRKRAVFAIREGGSQPGQPGLVASSFGIQGRDSVEQLTISEEGRTVDARDFASACPGALGGHCARDMQSPRWVAPDSVQDPLPEGASAEDISGLFDRPSNVAQLLHNLKVAVDRRLLVQPAFDNDAVLMKVFAGSAIERPPSNPVLLDHELSITIDDPHFPEMTVSLSLPKSAGRDARVRMNVVAVPSFDLCAVRDVFGLSAKVIRDSGVSDHGISYDRHDKGNVYYYSAPPWLANEASHARPTDTQVSFAIKLENANQDFPATWIQNRGEVDSVLIQQR